MTNKILIITSLLITSLLCAQQIGDGYSPVVINDFSAPLKSGIYNGLNTTTSGMAPDNSNVWQHLFVARHTNQTNNYQLQLASSFAVNDRLFFRKIVTGNLSSVNTTWVELATRGANTFNGNQIFNGNQTLSGNFIIGQEGTISTISGPASSGAIEIKNNGYSGGPANRYLRLGWRDNNAIFSSALSINDDLNVGIGTTIPKAKLDIFGNAVESTNIILAANYHNRFLWRLKTIDRGDAIDLDFTVSNHADDQENALRLTASNSGRPEFQLYNDAIVANNGNVGIGTANPTAKLTVAGNINSREVKVTVDAGADFVFENNYKLRSLDVVDKYIKENKHLPEIASADEMKKDGINLSEMNIKLLQKIEEMTLYMIEQNKKIIDLENRLEKVETK